MLGLTDRLFLWIRIIVIVMEHLVLIPEDIVVDIVLLWRLGD